MSNFFCLNDAYETRTRILTLRGLYPKPLDEGAMTSYSTTGLAPPTSRPTSTVSGTLLSELLTLWHLALSGRGIA